ncbi:hypothetical protein [Fulvimarina sp. MAC8]|uniref:hypothetical protein n=1 Tax=Fulvimarina sp. MAC8 TaxID=3162874 RepID=UPI0032EE309B
MNRRLALANLFLFAASGIALVWVRLSDLVSWKRAITNCAKSLAIDNSSFWLLGASGPELFPLLGLFSSERIHAMILAASVVLFLALPLLGYAILRSYAADRGYDWIEAPSVFVLRAYDVPAEGPCERTADDPPA